jgi:hypothetical protein
VKPAK